MRPARLPQPGVSAAAPPARRRSADVERNALPVRAAPVIFWHDTQGKFMQSESARMSSGAEARFRIDAPNSAPRQVKVVALDRTSETVVASLARRQWNDASFFTA